MNESRPKPIWISAKKVVSLYYKEEAMQFPPFFGSKIAQKTSKVIKNSSNIGKTTSKIFFPTL